jgi:hypothetical protein
MTMYELTYSALTESCLRIEANANLALKFQQWPTDEFYISVNSSVSIQPLPAQRVKGWGALLV